MRCRLGFSHKNFGKVYTFEKHSVKLESIRVKVERFAELLMKCTYFAKRPH